MADMGYAPAIVLSSPAVRAKNTALLLKDAGGFDAELRFDDRIYEASPQGLCQVVAELDDEYASAMLVGHNPGIEGFIRFLTARNESMPTAALAVIELDIDNWSEINDGRGELNRIFRPKDEMK